MTTVVYIPGEIYFCMNIHIHPRGAYGKVIIPQIMKCSEFLKCNCNEKDFHLRQGQNVWDHVRDLGPWSTAAAEFNEELSSVDGISTFSTFLLLVSIIINSNYKLLCGQAIIKSTELNSKFQSRSKSHQMCHVESKANVYKMISKSI